ncbi:hypothetical protein HMN09_00728000 [Mycena chlorophos]|uniref:Mucoidy inhibitor A n=1 Tax=Mycena chlorophos TaxID=658473 RepID=A0A8H6W7F7_MYCCL|nr:hypothetical protein HMN09_00728000 [Mycena chlorophos]
MTAGPPAANPSPPPFSESPAAPIELQAATASRITSVSVYAARAEVARVFHVALKTGTNQLVIGGLPTILEHESLRVEGRGNAVIQDVSIANVAPDEPWRSPRPTRAPNFAVAAQPTPELQALSVRLEAAVRARARIDKSVTAVENFLNSLTIEHIDATKLAGALHECEATTEVLDGRKPELDKEIHALETEITAQQQKERDSKAPKTKEVHPKLKTQVSISVFAEVEGQVEIVLKYAVSRATWTPLYDVRVNTDTKEKPITLLYKAAVKQDTGESWDEVPLTLETSRPTFGANIPELQPWDLRVYRPYRQPTMFLPPGSTPAPVIISPPSRYSHRSRSRSRSRSMSPRYRRRSHSREHSPPRPEIQFPTAEVIGSGAGVSATFRVPGTVSLPSDGQVHNFTIVKLALDGQMSWVCVPKLDTKVHLSAKITNESDFLLLRGNASVYLDGSFVARSEIPSVSPKESFNCSLGVDPAIRITYHPLIKNKNKDKTTSSGSFFSSNREKTETSSCAYTQRISVHNTKSAAVARLKIVDHIPASRDAQIEVRLISPALKVPVPEEDAAVVESKPSQSRSRTSALLSLKGNSNSSSSSVTASKLSKQVKVASGVVAQWDGADEDDADATSLGAERKLNWICAPLPAQGKVDLSLEWEVVWPAELQILGL